MPSCHLVPCIGGWRTAGLVQLSGISPGQPPPGLRLESGCLGGASGADSGSPCFHCLVLRRVVKVVWAAV